MHKFIKRPIFTKQAQIDPTNPLEIFKSRVQHLESITKPEEIIRTYNSIQGLRFGFKHADENLRTLTEGTINYLKNRSLTASHLMTLVKDTANLGICDPFLWKSYRERFDNLLKTENLNKTIFLKTCLYFDKYCPIALSLVDFNLNSYDPLFSQIKDFLNVNKGPQYYEDCLLYDSLTSNESQMTNPIAVDKHYRTNNFNIDRNVMAQYLRVLSESDAFDKRENRLASYNLSALVVQQLDKDSTNNLDINIGDTEFEYYTEYTWRSIANLIRFTIANPEIPNDDIKGLERYLSDKQQHHLIDFKSFIDIIQTIADNSEVFRKIGFRIMIDLCNMMWHQVENESVMFTTQTEHDLLVLIQSVNIIIEEKVLGTDVSFRLCKITDELIRLYKEGSFVKNGFEEYIVNEAAEFNKYKIGKED